MLTEQNTNVSPLITTSLAKHFKQGGSKVVALTNFDFELKPHEFVAIMGASGSGKSTLLHLMAGLTRPTSGSVYVAGNEINRFPDGALTRFRRRYIGLVFQSLNLVPTLTALENVCLPLQADNRSVDESKIAKELLQRLGLGDRLDHLPGSMSGGEQQRVAIARALSVDPALILADEPTGNLDSATSYRLCEQLKALNQEEGRAIVLVTHEPEVAMWADRVVVLKDGHKLQEFETASCESAQELAFRYLDLTEDSDSTGVAV